MTDDRFMGSRVLRCSGSGSWILWFGGSLVRGSGVRGSWVRQFGAFYVRRLEFRCSARSAELFEDNEAAASLQMTLSVPESTAVRFRHL